MNNFLDTDDRIKKVYVQGDAPFRMNPEDLNALVRAQRQRARWCRSPSFATGTWTYGSPKLERYNGISSVEIQGPAAPGQAPARR